MTGPSSSADHPSKPSRGNEPERAALFESLMDHSQDGFVIADFDNKIRYWNRTAESIFNTSSQEFVRSAIVEQCTTISKDEAAELERNGFFQKTYGIDDTVAQLTRPIQCSCQSIDVSDQRWILFRFNCPSDSEVLHDSAAETRVNELLRLSRTDELSGLLNRRGFQSLLEANLGARLALAIVDVDRFKQINDQHGHEIGDRAIQWIALKIESEFADAVCLGRLGGDEFGIVLELPSKLDSQMLIQRFERFCKFIKGESLDWLNSKLSISAGVAIGLGGGISARPLLSAADKAMYHSKNAGRNRSTAVQVACDGATSAIADD